MILWLWLLLARLLFLDTDDNDGGSVDETETEEDGDGDETEDETEEEIRDPKAKIKSLTEANARLARKLKRKDAEISDLKSASTQGDQLRTSRLETAFLRAVMASEEPISEPDTAWDLAQVKGFIDLAKVDESGNVTGMEDVLSKLTERYPWLLSDDADEDEKPPTPTGPSGRQPIKNKDVAAAAGKASMESRFPALRRRVGRR